LRAAATLTVRLVDSGSRKALSAVLAPDNEVLPGELLLSAVEEEESIRFNAESKSPATAVSAVLALLRDITLFQEVWLLSHGKDAVGRREAT
jgi:hypothetical protein